MFLRLVCWDLDGYDKVRGVTCGGQGASPVAGLVDGGQVGGAIWNIIFLGRLHPNLCNTITTIRGRSNGRGGGGHEGMVKFLKLNLCVGLHVCCSKLFILNWPMRWLNSR